VHVWDADTGQLIHLLEAPSRRGVESIGFSPDGTRIAAGLYRSPHVCLWDAQTGELVGNVGGSYTSSIEVHVAFSPDGILLATGSEKGVRLYDASSGQVLTVTRHVCTWQRG